jgi:hypothetical protein
MMLTKMLARSAVSSRVANSRVVHAGSRTNHATPRHGRDERPRDQVRGALREDEVEQDDDRVGPGEGPDSAGSRSAITMLKITGSESVHRGTGMRLPVLIATASITRMAMKTTPPEAHQQPALDEVVDAEGQVDEQRHDREGVDDAVPVGQEGFRGLLHARIFRLG